jgi:hypothetical protein
MTAGAEDRVGAWMHVQLKETGTNAEKDSGVLKCIAREVSRGKVNQSVKSGASGGCGEREMGVKKKIHLERACDDC